LVEQSAAELKAVFQNWTVCTQEGWSNDIGDAGSHVAGMPSQESPAADQACLDCNGDSLIEGLAQGRRVADICNPGWCHQMFGVAERRWSRSYRFDELEQRLERGCCGAACIVFTAI
jgi:hypothetical protein